MRDSQRKYKQKVIRKYIELYGSDKDIKLFIDILIKAGYNFQSLVKELIREFIREVQNGNRYI